MNKNKNKRIFNLVVRAKSPVECLYLREVKISDTEKSYKRQNDITLLFNQQRIEKTIGVDTINHWLESLSSSASSVLDNLRKKVSDNELLKFIKSRHLQSISELLLWSEYLEENVSKELSRVESELKDVSSNDVPNNDETINVTPE